MHFISILIFSNLLLGFFYGSFNTAHSANGLNNPPPLTEMPNTPNALKTEECFGIAFKDEHDGILPSRKLDHEKLDYDKTDEQDTQDQEVEEEKDHYVTINGDGYAWIDLPFGLCERLKLGSLKPFLNRPSVDERETDEPDDVQMKSNSKNRIEQRIEQYIFR